jgi:hypothetical protein
MEHDLKFYAIVIVLAILSIASILTLNLALIIAALLISALLVAFYKLYYIIESVIFKRTNLIQVIDGCELSGDRTTTIRRVRDGICATAAALLENGSNSAVEKDKIENIVANSHCTFKFVMQVERVDVHKLLDRLQTKRSMIEIEISKLDEHPGRNNIAKINSLKRKADQISHEIEKVTSGSTPLKVAQYIITSSISESKTIAQERARSQIRELASEFGALIGTKSEILSGDDLLTMLKFDSVIR